MKTNLKFARPFAAALGLAALAAPAYAADVVSEEPPAPAPIIEAAPVASWMGPYAGVNLGYGFSGHSDVHDGGPNVGTDGFLGGAFLGYNYQMDNFVVGAEGDVGYNGVNGDKDGVKTKGGMEGSLRARLGYTVSPDILLYGTGGVAARSQKVTYAGDSDSNTHVGWTAGAGADINITENVFGRVEYRYTDYGSKNYDSVGTKVGATDNRINFGVGMKF